MESNTVKKNGGSVYILAIIPKWSLILHRETQLAKNSWDIWFGLFNGISTPYGLFNAEIWFISKCSIIIVTFHIFRIPLQSLFLNHTFSLSAINIVCTQFYGIKYSYLIQIICTQFYGIKYSYLIQIICAQFYGIKYSYLIQIICAQFYGI